MAGMIQGIDGGALIAALRAGKDDRYQDQKRQMDLRSAQIGLDQKQQERGLVGQLMGGQPTPSLAGQYAPSNPVAATAPSFDQAFNPQSMTAISHGQDAPMSAPPVAPPPVQGMPQPPQTYDPVILNKLTFANPEKYVPIMNALRQQDEFTLKRTEDQNSAMAGAAHYLARYPAQDRPAHMQYVAEHLAAAGITPDKIANFHFNDDGLQAYMEMGQKYGAMIDDELKRREFEAGKVITPQPGAGAFVAHPNGTVDTIVAPNDGSHPVGSPVSGGSIPHVSNAADYAAIPPGAQYTTPDGHVRQKPGGPTQPASGTF